MAALITLVAIGLFAAGVFAGMIGLASVAVRREEANLTLTSGAADTVTRIGRGLNGVYVQPAPPVCVPRRTATAGRQTTVVRFRRYPERDSASPGRCGSPFRSRGEGESS